MASLKRCSFCKNAEVFPKEEGYRYFDYLKVLYFANDPEGGEKLMDWYSKRKICAICSCNIQKCITFNKRFSLLEASEARKSLYDEPLDKPICHLCLKDGQSHQLIRSKLAIERISNYCQSVPNQLLLTDATLVCLFCNCTLNMWHQFKDFISKKMGEEPKGKKRSLQENECISSVPKLAKGSGLILCSSMLNDDKFMKHMAVVRLKQETKTKISFPRINLQIKTLPEHLDSKNYESFVSGKPLEVEDLIEALNHSNNSEDAESSNLNSSSRQESESDKMTNEDLALLLSNDDKPNGDYQLDSSVHTSSTIFETDNELDTSLPAANKETEVNTSSETENELESSMEVSVETEVITNEEVFEVNTCEKPKSIVVKTSASNGITPGVVINEHRLIKVATDDLETELSTVTNGCNDTEEEMHILNGDAVTNCPEVGSEVQINGNSEVESSDPENPCLENGVDAISATENSGASTKTIETSLQENEGESTHDDINVSVNVITKDVLHTDAETILDAPQDRQQNEEIN